MIFFRKCLETTEIYSVLFIFTARINHLKACFRGSSLILDIISYLAFKVANASF